VVEENNVENNLTRERKLDHIKAVLERGVESLHTTLLENVRLVHNPLPELDLDDVTLETEFCGRRVETPLMITGMTGGHPDVAKINQELAKVAEEYGLIMGVGSQRAGIEDPGLIYTYKVAREAAPNAFLVANIGAPQLSKGYGLREALKAINMIEADAIAIHLNPAQEAYQKEGDPYYRNVITRIVELADVLDTPVIIKETGTGLSYETIRELYNLGIKCFDVAGLGGTNWVKVEVIRSALRGEKPLPAGPLADYWGNPTATAVVEARYAAPGAYIVGSGGVRNGLDVGKVLALGADIAGIALPALKVLLRNGYGGLREYIDNMLYQVKTILYLTGSRTPWDLWRIPITITGKLKEELTMRGIDLERYISLVRLEPLRVRSWSHTVTLQKP